MIKSVSLQFNNSDHVHSMHSRLRQGRGYIIKSIMTMTSRGRDVATCIHHEVHMSGVICHNRTLSRSSFDVAVIMATKGIERTTTTSDCGDAASLGEEGSAIGASGQVQRETAAKDTDDSLSLPGHTSSLSSFDRALKV